MPEACNSNRIEHAAHVTTHQSGAGQDGTWYSRCGCGELACASGTQEEAIAALEAHRAEQA